MEMTTRALWALIRGMGFGGLYLLACSGALVEIWRGYSPSAQAAVTSRDEAFLRIYLAGMALLAWATVITGAYIVYPWYRATPPPDALSLTGYPQRLLLSSPSTIAWRSIGME